MILIEQLCQIPINNIFLGQDNDNNTYRQFYKKKNMTSTNE